MTEVHNIKHKISSLEKTLQFIKYSLSYHKMCLCICMTTLIVVENLLSPYIVTKGIFIIVVVVDICICFLGLS